MGTGGLLVRFPLNDTSSDQGLCWVNYMLGVWEVSNVLYKPSDVEERRAAAEVNTLDNSSTET